MDNIKRMDERQAALHEHFPSTHYLHKQENVMRLMEWITFYRRNPSRLDVELSHCYDIMMLNPEGCFTTSNGNPVKPARAKEILENMAQSLGVLIDSENGLLTNTLKSDKDR